MKEAREKKRGGQRQGRGGVGASVELELERLARRFEQYRRSHEAGSRIPDALRAAALAVLDRGASEGDLRRACQATAAQQRQWRAQLKRGTAMVGDPDPRVARVFDVIDDGPGELEAESGRRPAAAELELRLGSWALRISQLDG